jgi:hypothetical protein
MNFDELIREFGITVETYENQMYGSISLHFVSNDSHYGYTRIVTREELDWIDICELERRITEEVRVIFKTREYEMKKQRDEATLDWFMNELREYIPACKKELVRNAFREEDPDSIYALMPTRNGRIQAISAFHNYLEAIRKPRLIKQEVDHVIYPKKMPDLRSEP